MGSNHGTTKHGDIVHAHTHDHHPEGTRYQRFNKKVALWITEKVGTMTCFWVFNGISFIGLPAAMTTAGLALSLGPIGWIAMAGFIVMVQWTAQSWLQLVLLPALMVGQNLQNEAADVRTAKQFEDTEEILSILRRMDEGSGSGNAGDGRGEG